MIDPVFLLAAFLTGLAGAGHCAGMCGGIAGALAHPGATRPWQANLSYSAGRVSTYALLGTVAGGFSALLAPSDAGLAMAVMRTLTGLVLLALALYLLNIVAWIRVLETIGSRAWRRVTPLVRRLLPADSVPKALAVGMLWGLLPCGLVYGALLYAASSGSAVAGMATMLAFGAGTLPAVLALGAAARWLARNAASVRRMSGSLMLVYAIWTLASTAISLPAILAGTCRSPGDVLQVVLASLTHVK